VLIDMGKIKLVAQAVTDDLNSEDSIMIGAMERGTDWLFKLILLLGVPYLIYVVSQLFNF
jgi:hypothetical protein